MKIISVRSRHAACALVSALAFGSSFVPGQLNAAPDKLELLSGAIKARQKGNLTEARKILEELNAASPGDQRVITLLNQVKTELGLKDKAASKELPGTPVAETKKPEAKKPEAKKAEAKKPEKKELTKDEIADILSGKASGENKVKVATADIEHARSQLAAKKYDDANTTIVTAIEKVKDEPLAEAQFKELQELRKEVYLEKTDNAIRGKDVKVAEESIKEYGNLAGKDDEKYQLRSRQIEGIRKNPYSIDADSLNPEGISQRRKVDDLLTKGRALYIAGDNEAAYRVFQDVEATDGNNPEAKFFQAKIAEQRKELNRINYTKTREIFLQTVNQNWALPTIYDRTKQGDIATKETVTQRKLNQIKIDDVNFRGLPLSRVIETLSALSVKNDTTKLTAKPGVNIVLLDPTGSDPTVNITLRDLTLQRVLEFVCEQVGYEADVSDDAVTIAPSKGDTTIRLRTEFFPVNQNALIRMGVVKPSAAVGGGAATATDPFAPAAPGAGEASPAGGGGDSKEDALKKFFERAGVGFGNVTGSSLALTEAQVIVTQTQRNLERIGKILRQFSDTRQVTISSRFLEVQQGDLEEFGFDFLLRGNNAVFATNNRSLNDSFAPRLNAGRGINVNTVQGTVVIPGNNGNPDTVLTSASSTANFPTGAPSLPGSVNLGTSGAAGYGANSGPRTLRGGTMQLQESGLAAYQGTLGSYELEAVIKALSQKSGNDLMSAPTVTTMSDRQAKITVSQELLYPTEYGDIQVEAPSNSTSIIITPGTPTGFEKRDVGIEMTVTPKIQEDGSIFLDIEPRVTEFEGFIEYGTTSVAISGNTTVTVPPGFFQPVFTVRHVKTEVTIWDGATVLLGGLSREQVLTVEDKVPILGDIPFIGRLFSSKGQSSSKKNLLIFVTGNIIGPGGAPARQSFPGLPQGSIYSDAVLVTPAGPVQRDSFNQTPAAR